MTLAWLDDRFVAAEVAALAGEIGVFETLGAYGQRLPLWNLHLARLLRGARRLGLAGEPPAELHARAQELLSRNAHDVLRITWTADAAHRTSLAMTTRQRSSLALVRLHVAAEPRASDEPFADLKHVARAAYERASQHARSVGCDDAVICDADGHVLETTTCNLLLCGEDGWTTPRLNGAFLSGIARGLLLDALARRGTPAREAVCTLDDLRAADEIWVTNAVYGPRPAQLGVGPPVTHDDLLPALWRAIVS